MDLANFLYKWKTIMVNTLDIVFLFLTVVCALLFPEKKEVPERLALPYNLITNFLRL